MIRGKRVRDYKHVFLLLYVPVYLICFFLVEHLVPSSADYWVSYCRLDDLIPFCEYFIIPYYMWYPFLFMVGIYLIIKDVPLFKRYMYCIIIGFSFCLVFYLVFPNGQNLRPETFARDNIFVDMVKAIYAVDTNTNVLPSMHVVGSVFAAACICSTKSLKEKWVKPSAVFLAVLISLSTCFVKQHSILDAFAGVGVAAVIYAAVYIFMRKGLRNS